MNEPHFLAAINKMKFFQIFLMLAITSWYSLIHVSCTNKKDAGEMGNGTKTPARLRVSPVNPHLLETVDGTPVFLNNYTVWKLIKNGTQEQIAEFMSLCKDRGFNMISCVILNDRYNGSTAYGVPALALDSLGFPDPTKPAVTPGDDARIPGQYDYWDHVEYVIDQAAENGLYISLHPTWGIWVSGGYSGPVPGDTIIFNVTNAYEYGRWLGQHFGRKSNLIWMLGGDRSAIYDLEDGPHDFRPVWRAMAEGLADGTNVERDQNGQADYRDMLISFHPRKWAPNSSEWFHNDAWLTFNSIQDTPYDQIVSMPHDYHLKPVKPSWLFEGRYEGATSPWAVRYQAYQTVFAGGFGSTYGSENWEFPSNWQELMALPGAGQMAHLYKVARDIWTDEQFFNRIPDQSLIIGDQGDTRGDGMTVGDGDGGPEAGKKVNATSDRITAIRSREGKWAMVYSANGQNITLDLSRLSPGVMDACWFDPRIGMWRSGEQTFDRQTPFLTGLQTGTGKHVFDPPGDPGAGNDWVLVLK
jgi:hypothetical protein